MQTNLQLQRDEQLPEEDIQSFGGNEYVQYLVCGVGFTGIHVKSKCILYGIYNLCVSIIYQLSF